MQCQSDLLLERARNRDAEAFVELFRRHERRARAVAARVLTDSATVNDIIQEALTRAWERIPSLRNPRRFGTWFCGIVHNLAIDDLRRRRIFPSWACMAEVPDSAIRSDPLARICRDERRERLNDAIAALEALSGAALVMRYYEDLMKEDIATLLEVTPAAIAMRLFRARAKLRGMLREMI